MRLQAHFRRLSLLLLAALFSVGTAANLPASAQAVTVTTNETIPFTNTLPNTCNGDQVTFSGNLHMTNHVTTDANGGFHLRTHVNYQNVSGTGAPSGLNYRVTTTTNDTLNDPDGPQSSATIIQVVNLISQGPAPNFLLRFKFHLTINANGTTTSTITETKIECTGSPN